MNGNITEPGRMEWKGMIIEWTEKEGECVEVERKEMELSAMG